MTALPSLLSPANAPTAAPAAAHPARRAPEPGRGFAQALGAARDGALRPREAMRTGAEPTAERPERDPDAATPDTDEATGPSAAEPTRPTDAAEPARAEARTDTRATETTTLPGTAAAGRDASGPLPLDAIGLRAAVGAANGPRALPAEPANAAGRPAPGATTDTADNLATDPLAATGRAPLARAGAAPGHAALQRLLPAGERPDPAAPQAGAGAVSAAASTAVVLPGTAVEAVGAAAASRTPDGAGFAAVMSAAVSSPTPGLAAPAAEAAIAAPPGSPAFASEIAAQVSTFVRDGVQEAQLHLNPAEMGPVEVRIQLDGDAARVVLAADQAPTRQWLEQALPTLAGSLREAGLTLAGGGVFERAPGGDSGTGGGTPGQGRGRPDGAADGSRVTDSPREAAPRRRGVVDLVA